MKRCPKCGGELERRDALFCERCGARVGEAVPLTLEINDNHFYMERHAGILDLRVSSSSDRPVDARLSVQGSFLGSRSERREARVRLAPGENARRMFQVVPSLAGEHLIELKLCCELGGELRAYVAQPLIRVLKEQANPSSLTFHIGSPSGSEGAKIGFGMSIKNELHERFAAGLIKDANDLLGQRFADHWEPIPLFIDEDAALAGEEAPAGTPSRTERQVPEPFGATFESMLQELERLQHEDLVSSLAKLQELEPAGRRI
ncbi:MAG: zinc ribbon domain-containing protein [Planctomycetes bacterium]|nr:zinc ribbon domain-containing protein [Planctomycetota bacterium]